MTGDNFDTIAEQLLGDRDVDDDSVVNYNDCRPLDPRYQDLRGTFSKVAGRLKSGAQAIKGKYQELKEKKEAVERGEEVKKEVERHKELEELKKQREELERQRELAEEKKKLEKSKRELKWAKPKGTLEKIGEVLMGGAKKASGGRSRSIDSDDKWAVVDYSDGSIIATFHYKTDARDFSSQSNSFGVMRTSRALGRGFDIGSAGQAIDIFGGDSGPGDLENMVIGEPGKGELDFLDEGKSGKEKKPWFERGLV